MPHGMGVDEPQDGEASRGNGERMFAECKNAHAGSPREEAEITTAGAVRLHRSGASWAIGVRNFCVNSAFVATFACESRGPVDMGVNAQGQGAG